MFLFITVFHIYHFEFCKDGIDRLGGGGGRWCKWSKIIYGDPMNYVLIRLYQNSNPKQNKKKEKCVFHYVEGEPLIRYSYGYRRKRGFRRIIGQQPYI